MAKADVKEKEEVEVNEEESSSKAGMSTIKIVIIAVVVSVVLGGGLVGGTFYFVSNMDGAQATASVKGANKTAGEEGDADAEEADAVVEDAEPLPEPKYYSMDPKFIVSFSNQSSARFMQFSIEVMTRDADVIKKLEKHMPVIRSSLLMLYGGQQYEDMVSREGKQKLLDETTADINASLRKMSGDTEDSPLVESAYFDSFVIQ